MRGLTPFLIALAAGLVWILIGEFEDRHGQTRLIPYSLSLGYPVMLLIVFLQGWFFRVRSWRWGLTVVLVHTIGLIILEDFPNILPFTPLIELLMLISFVVAGCLGAWIASWLKQGREG